MGSTKSYGGYRSFDYLVAGEDYDDYRLAPEIDRVPAHRIELDAEAEARASRLAADTLMISMHEHLGVFPEDVDETPDYVRQGRMATAFEGVSHSHWDAVFDNLMDGLCQIESRSGWKWTEVLHDLGMRLCDLAHQSDVVVGRTVQDILDARAGNRLAWLASIEGAAMIENEVDRIDVLYGFGVRMLGITYSEANALGSGLKEPRDGGLTAFGRRAVARMNRVGMLIDCSHTGDQTALDTMEVSERPVVLSHIGARALWDSGRLAPDEVLVACARTGGVIGIEAAPHTTITRRTREHSIDSYMEHFEYVKDLVGIDHVGFGPDSLYGDHAGLHRVYTTKLSLQESRKAKTSQDESYPRVPYVRGLENPTEGSHTILHWLVRHGYSDEDITKVMGGNVMRVLREVWS